MADSNSFTSHFVELRSRLLNSLIFIFAVFVISYFFAEHIYNFLVEPYADAVKDDKNSRRLIFTALHETFITYIKVVPFYRQSVLLVKFTNLLHQVFIKMKKHTVILFQHQLFSFRRTSCLFVMPLCKVFIF